MNTTKKTKKSERKKKPEKIETEFHYLLPYLRVSTSKQADEGASLDTQEKQIQNYIELHTDKNGKKYKIKKIYKDAGISAGSIVGRIELENLLKEIQSGESMIIFNLSRLARNTLDSLTILDKLREKGANLISLNPDIDFSTPIGQMMFTTLSAFSALERDNIKYNVKANMRQLSKDGMLRGKAPFGYKYISRDQPMVEDNEQQDCIKYIIELFESKHSYSAIAKILNEDGWDATLSNNKKKQKPQKFHAQTVRRILIDQGYKGNNTIEQNARKPIAKRIKCYRTERIQKDQAKKIT